MSNCSETEKQGGVTRAYTAIYVPEVGGNRYTVHTIMAPRYFSKNLELGGKHVLYKKVSFTSHGC